MLSRILERPTIYALWQAPFVKQKLRPFLARRGCPENLRVLEIGCGPGTNAAIFSGCDYTGIDISPEYIEKAASRHRGRFVSGDASTFDYGSLGQIDLVFMNSLLHHLSDEQVRALFRKLCPQLGDHVEINILDLILPDSPSPSRLMARMDRGGYSRPLNRWKELLGEFIRPGFYQPHSVGLVGVPLWKMFFMCGTKALSP